MNVFTPDAVIVTKNKDFVGHEAIRQFYVNGVMKFREFQPIPGPFHIAGNSVSVEIILKGDGKESLVGDWFTTRGDKIEKLVVYEGRGYNR